MSPTPIVLRRGGSELQVSAADVVVWELQPGTAPVFGNFVVARDRAEEFDRVSPPGAVTLEWDGRRFRNLRFLGLHPNDGWTHIVRIADRRHDWQYPGSWKRANWRRKANVKIEIAEEILISPERFLPWSLNPSTGKAWTSKELAIDVLARLIADAEDGTIGRRGNPLARAADLGFDVEAASALRDNNRVADNFESLGDSGPDMVGRLLADAGLAVTVDPVGTVEMFDPIADPTLPNSRIKGGAFRVPDLSRIRPKKVRVGFVKEEQIRYQEPTGGITVPIGQRIRNVLQLPSDTTILGKLLKRGTWVSMTNALDVFGFTDLEVQKSFVTGGALLRKDHAQLDADGFSNPVVMARIDAVLAHYRQTFQINPLELESVLSWSPTTVEVADISTGERIPAPVFTRWFDQSTAFGIQAVAALNHRPGRNLSSFGPGEEGAIADGLAGAPYTVAVVDQDLGIFRIQEKTITDGIVKRRFPSHLLDIPDEFSANSADNNLLANCALSPNHRIEVSLSVIRATPNDRRVHHFVDLDFSAEGGLVEQLEIVHLAETAKFGEDAARLANGITILAIARAEAESAMADFRDRPTGVLTVTHDPAAVWAVRSFARSIEFRRSGETPPEVIVDFGERPPRPSAFNFLPQRTRNLLQRTARVDLPVQNR